jgi:hypothetical protein
MANERLSVFARMTIEDQMALRRGTLYQAEIPPHLADVMVDTDRTEDESLPRKIR